MKYKKSKNKNRVIILSILIIALVANIYINFFVNLYDSNLEETSEDNESNEKDDEDNPIEDPELNIEGDDPWWNQSFLYRQLINVTNPYDVSLGNYGVNITFNYRYYVDLGHMNESLKDVRIVESGILRKYYIEIDYPFTDWATIWFDTNVSAAISPTEPTTETDTYMYYGNNSVDYANSYLMDGETEAFGWIKNGNFELDDDDYGQSNYDVYGYTWTNKSMYDEWNKDNNGFVNKLLKNSEAQNWETDTGEGMYSYKWGDPRSTVSSFGDVQQYAGTLISYPFKVPIVTGGGASKINMTVYRNIRVIGFEDVLSSSSYQDNYAARISDAGDNCEYYSYDPQGSGRVPLETVEKYKGSSYLSSNHELKHTITQDIYDTSNAEVTGYITIDLTNYMGETIFFEIGMGGNERSRIFFFWWDNDAAFGQVDDLRFTYDLGVAINEEEKQRSTVKIIAKDVDGRIVPNAEITLLNSSNIELLEGPYEETTSTSIDEGSATFTRVEQGEYNITANFTLNSGLEKVMYNSSKLLSVTFTFNRLFHTIEIELNITTIDFEIVDWDEIPFDMGYINISKSESSEVLETLPLDSNGKTTFRWLNLSTYYYEVIFNNSAYKYNNFLLNKGYIYRTTYDTIGEKYQNHQILVNQSNVWTPVFPQTNKHYEINTTIYTNGSYDELGNKKLINFTITMTNMIDEIKEVKIYYVSDADDETPEENLIFSKDDYPEGTDSTTIKIDIMTLDHAKLKSENHEAYGLRIYVFGDNDTICNGIIDVNFTETRNIFNQTELSKLYLKVIYKNPDYPDGEPLGGAIVKVFDGSVDSTNLLVNLTTLSRGADDPLTGWASSNPPDYITFWYKVGQAYNFTLRYFGEDRKFNVTSTDPSQWMPTGNDGEWNYNYTLNQQSNITINLIIPPEVVVTYYSALTDRQDDSPAVWGELLTISINFSYTVDNGTTWNPINEPDVMTCTFRTAGEVDLFTEQMIPQGDGNHSITINSNRLSAGGSSKYYYYYIYAEKYGYGGPQTTQGLIQIFAKPTGISTYEYDTLVEVPSAEFSEYFNEYINITIKYYIDDISETPLTEATLTYDWLGLSPQIIELDPINLGYFTFTLYTGDAGSIGIQRININAEYENYTTQDDLIIFLEIKPRETSINGETKLLSITEDIYIWDEFTYTFSYKDITYGISENIENAQEAYFYWWEIDEDGEMVDDVSSNIDLTETTDHKYFLDFEAEEKDVGEYRLYVTLNKYNYETQHALINLEIEKRLIDTDLSATNYKDDVCTVVKGEDIVLELELTDPTQDDDPLEDATVILTIGDKEYEFKEEGDGIYTYTFKTDEIDAFFTSQTLAGEITIEKDDYEDETIDITFVITMEEIYPGVPTFYFILITAAIIGTAGSLISYRVIQQARIPAFVKKVRKVKKAIKAKKGISESLLYPPKDKLILKQYGSRWENLGLSPKEVFRMEEKKKRTLPKMEDSFEQGGDGV